MLVSLEELLLEKIAESEGSIMDRPRTTAMTPMAIFAPSESPPGWVLALVDTLLADEPFLPALAFLFLLLLLLLLLEDPLFMNQPVSLGRTTMRTPTPAAF